MRAKFLHMADCHLGYRQYNLNDRYNDFGRAFLQVIDVAIAEKVDFVLLAGDLFHKRSLDALTLNQAVVVLERLRNAGIPCIAVEGNHEHAYFDDYIGWMEFLNNRQLIVLLDAKFADGKPTITPYKRPKGSYIDPVPGLRVHGLRYLGAGSAKGIDAYACALAEQSREGLEYNIFMTHAGLEGEVDGMSGLSMREWSCLREHADYVALGHIHKPYTREDWLYNPGSLETCSSVEVAWKERGYYMVEVDTERSEGPKHHATLRANTRRHFERMYLKTDLIESPEALYKQVHELMTRRARDIGANRLADMKPVVDVHLQGLLNFERSALSLTHIEDMARELLNALHPLVRNETHGADYSPTSGGGSMNRQVLERNVLSDLFSRDARYAPRSRQWARLALDLKTLVLDGADPESILDELEGRMARIDRDDEPEVTSPEESLTNEPSATVEEAQRMQILTVDLENVKSYEKAEVTFSPGVNAIVGHNGAGKSTILEAIGFTLFDALDYNHTEFIRGGAKSARARVAFVSNVDDRVYEVERRIGSGAHYIVHDPQLGTRLCDGKADVVRFLRQHLKVEPGADLTSIFKDAVGVPQGTLTAAFLLNDANRKRVFEALLRVEEYSRVWERLREPLNLLKTRKSEVDSEISRLQGRLERLPVLEAEIAERKQTLQAVQGNLGKATAALDSVQTTRAKLERAREALLAAERALAESQRKLQGVQARHNAAEQARADAAAAQKLVTEHQAGYVAYLEAQRNQEALDARVRQRQLVESQRAAADKRVALHEEKARVLQSDFDKTIEAERTVADLQGAVIEQTRLEGELETARQQEARLEDAKRVVTRQQADLKRLQMHHAELAKQLSEAQEVERQLKATKMQSESGRKELDAGRERMAGLKSQADLIKEQSQRLEDVQTTVCPICEQALTAGHRQEMLKRNNSRLDEMRANYRDANKQVQTLETTLHETETALKKWQDALMKLPRQDEAVKAGQDVERAETELQRATGEVTALADAAQKVAAASLALTALGDPRRRYTVASEQAKRRKGLEAQMAQNTQELTRAQDDLTKLQQALADFGDLEGQLDAVAATLQAHRVAYQTVLGNQRQAEALAQRVQEAVTLAQELSELKAAGSELESQHRAAAANFDATAYAEAAAREQELQREVGTLRGQSTSLESSQSKAERELVDLRGLTALVVAAEGKLTRLKDEEEVLETIRGKIRQAGPYISATLNRQISDGAGQIFSDLMQDYTRILTWNEDYSISLEVDGRQRSFSQLSGGEQMSAALSVRLALLREMSSIDIAFFDEPTANLDEVRREALARQILHVKGFTQLFVISHDDTFEQATQNLIRVERVSGTSRVVER